MIEMPRKYPSMVNGIAQLPDLLYSSSRWHMDIPIFSKKINFMIKCLDVVLNEVNVKI